LFRSFYNLKCSLRQPWLQVISNTIEAFTKYFGVCSKNPPVLPDKIAHCEKNVSRETFVMGSGLRVPAALWISNSAIVAWVAWLLKKQHRICRGRRSTFRIAGYAYALGQWKMGVTGYLRVAEKPTHQKAGG
jgi:hypothetical protein